MMTQTLKQIGIFPDLPRGVPLINKDGFMNPQWQFYFDSLTLALQTNFKPEGFVIPPVTASNIALLTGVPSNNNILFDSTNDEFKGNISGTWKTFTLT